MVGARSLLGISSLAMSGAGKQQEREARGREEARAGRDAAERLCVEWPDVSWVPGGAPSTDYARAAIERLAELMREERNLSSQPRRIAARR
jgi:hypothetical protein